MSVHKHFFLRHLYAPTEHFPVFQGMNGGRIGWQQIEENRNHLQQTV